MSCRPPQRRAVRSLLPALALLAGCTESDAPPGPSASATPDGGPPVLVVGLDGFDWRVALPLMRAGELPVLQALAERGVHGKLETLKPTLSPRIWGTIATGKSPEQHGVEDFVVRTEDGRTRKVTSLDRKAKAFWNVLTDAGLASDTIGWWTTWPAEEVLGLMVAQTNTLEGPEKGALLADAPRQVWPASEEAGVLEVLRAVDARLAALRDEVFGPFDEAALSPGQRRRLDDCDWALRADATYQAVLADRVATHGPAAVTSLYLGSTDVVGHRFWAAYRPEPFGFDPASDEVRRFGHLVPAIYRHADRVVGEVLALFPADTTVLVVSDHGMSHIRSVARSGMTADQVDRFTGGHTLADPGALIAAGPRIATQPFDPHALRAADVPTLGGMADVCPTLLALVGLPYGEDMQGRPLLSVLDPAFVAAQPPRSVPTHDDPAWRAARAAATLEVEEDAERLRQLEALGYLGDG